MSKQDHTVYIYKADKRTKSGERLVSTNVWRNRDEAEMKREVRELQYRDTPWCCNPASESYWSA